MPFFLIAETEIMVFFYKTVESKNCLFQCGIVNLHWTVISTGNRCIAEVKYIIVGTGDFCFICIFVVFGPEFDSALVGEFGFDIFGIGYDLEIFNFSGKRVVALNPDDETLEKYGLGKKQEQYIEMK